jgi:ectoine hydroxylase-related dioxygenase (phytanoyl-CoA dioxygenase family)
VADFLTNEQREDFQKQGIVYPLRVLSQNQADSYRQECDHLEGQLGGKPRTVDVRQMHLHFDWAYRLATESRVLDAVEDLLGPDLLIWATELFAKHPADRAVSIGWHRDRPYMGLDPQRTLTAWIALSRSTVENGCMRFVRENDRKRDPGGMGDGSRPFNRRKETRQFSQKETVPVVLDAGEMSVHDVHVLHGSDPNCGPEKRVGFAIRFTTPHTLPLIDRPPAVLARGTDRFGHFDLREPQFNDENALAAMRGSARRHLDATLRNLQNAQS